MKIRESLFLLLLMPLGIYTSCGIQSHPKQKDPVRIEQKESSRTAVEYEKKDRVETTERKRKSIHFYQGLLEDFCKLYYHKAFEGRTYIYGSLCIVSVDYLSETIIEIKGTHSYEGIMGKQYTGYAFKANVRELGNDRFLVTFEKQSIKILSRKKYWERTSREIAYSE